MFPIAPGFYDPIWFAQSSIPVYITWKGQSIGEHIAGKNKGHAAAAAAWINLEAWNLLTVEISLHGRPEKEFSCRDVTYNS
jgi:hypothetical protein